MSSDLSSFHGIIDYDFVKRNLANPIIAGSEINEYQKFLPQDIIDFLVQQQNVKATISGVSRKLKSPYDIDKLTNYVVFGNAKRVFMTLVISGTLKHIQDCALNGFTDKDMPVATHLNSNGKLDMRTAHVNENGNTQQVWSFFSTWKSKNVDFFLDSQWKFLAPSFRSSQLDYVFHLGTPLPFLPPRIPASGAGFFAGVRKKLIHPSHLEVASSPRNMSQHLEFAVKTLNADGTQMATDVEKFYQKELRTIRTMRDFNHAHLIKAIAAYKRGPYRCFVFPWADGGNLRTFWATHNGRLDEGLVSWVLGQMIGLCDGLAQLHETNTRHGDIKPENILCFGTTTSSKGRGTLTIADVGLAKVHEEYTRDRVKCTTTRHGSTSYEPPEIINFSKGMKLSRKYDVWSLGCVFLELTSWLFLGPTNLEQFRDHLRQGSEASRFWKGDSPDVAQLHQAVKHLMRQLKSVLTGIRSLTSLIEIIENHCLVVHVNDRWESIAVHRELEKVYEEWRSDAHKWPSTNLPSLARQRNDQVVGRPNDGAKENISQRYNSRTSALDDQWRNITDRRLARALVSRLDWRSLQPKNLESTNCSACSAIDFQQGSIEIRRNLHELQDGSKECSLCSLLFLSFSKIGVTADDQLILKWDENSLTFRSSFGGPSLIAPYVDPEATDTDSPYATVGLPILPEPASPAQFKLLREWLRLCDERHSCIIAETNSQRRDVMPTRLLEVGTMKSPFIRLFESDDQTRGKYVALSHCWGKLSREQRFCTYADNVEEMMKTISFDALPKNFQDAVTVTRAIGVPYLWIDSLCIIQEDKIDWEKEASRMEDVFSFAYCTIAASSAAASLDGFLGERSQRLVATAKTAQGPLYLAEAIDDFRTDVEQSVLSTRGWVLQERALSRRTIYFTRSQVYWECGEGVHCESLAQLRNPESQFLGDPHFPRSGLKYYKDERIRLVQHVYQSYCALNLTHATDRSKAILGLQDRLGKTFQSKALYGILWKFFERTLLWQAEDAGSLVRIPYNTDNHIPSWSWMARSGKVRYPHIPFDGVHWEENIKKPFEDISASYDWNGTLVATANQLLIDATEFSKRSTLDSHTPSLQTAPSWCIVIGTSKAESSDGISAYVLLIDPTTSQEDCCTFERIGVAKILTTHILPDTRRIQLV